MPTNEPDDLYTIQNNNLNFAVKLAFSISPTSSAQPALPENPGRAGWAELVGETEQAHLAVTLDFYSAWYRDHLIPFRAKYEQFFFGLTGPSKAVM